MGMASMRQLDNRGGYFSKNGMSGRNAGYLLRQRREIFNGECIAPVTAPREQRNRYRLRHGLEAGVVVVFARSP